MNKEDLRFKLDDIRGRLWHCSKVIQNYISRSIPEDDEVNEFCLSMAGDCIEKCSDEVLQIVNFLMGVKRNGQRD